MDFLHVVEWTTVSVTFLMIFSGIPPCLSMYKSKETKNIPFLFFLVCFTTSITGLHYGVLLDNNILKLVNTAGTVLWAVYILIYVLVAHPKGDAIAKVVGTSIVVLCQIAYLVCIVQESKLIITKLGTFLFVWSNAVASVPSLQILDVVKHKSSRSIQVSLLCGGLMCSLTWLLYGYLINDFNIYAPNIVGSGVNLTLVGLYIVYRDRTKTKVE